MSKKNLLKLFLVIFCSVNLFFADSLKYITAGELNVYYSGARLHFKTSPVYWNGILYIPLRDIAEGMGLDFNYNRNIDHYFIKRAADFLTVTFKLNSNKIKINDATDELASPILLFKNSVYAPLSDFLWPLGYFVEHTNNNYYIVSKVKDIQWQEQSLKILGQAPIQAELTYQEGSYNIIIRDCILGMEQKEIVCDDGSVTKITVQQQALAPAIIRIRIFNQHPLKYTILKEDAENAYVVIFDYKPVITSKIVETENERPVMFNTYLKPPAALVAPSFFLSTGNNRQPSSNVLWLPERRLAQLAKVDFVIKGRLYPDIPLHFSNKVCQVRFADVFSHLQGFKYTGQTYLPLVATLKTLGYAAYYSDNKIYINPRIQELSYLKNKTEQTLLIKANDRLQPKKILYLNNPPRAILDILNAAYDVPQNYLRVQDENIKIARGAQFDKGIVRIVLELSRAGNVPEVGFENEGRTIALIFKNKNIILEKPKTVALPKMIEQTSVQPPKLLVPEPQPPVTHVGGTKTLAGLRVAIIPGHGGTDAGAISRTGYMEKIPTLELAKKVSQLLSQAGAMPLLCRTEDKNVSLEDQAQFCQGQKADLLVSIHFNSFVSNAVRGAESYYFKPSDHDFARMVHEEIIKIPGIRNKGLKKAMMHNLNHTTMPGVLIEPLFLSNRQEEALARDPDFQWQLARAVVRGIEKYQRRKQ